MKTHTITVELTDEQCQAMADSDWSDIDYVLPVSQAKANFAAAVREQWSPPSRDPQVGAVVRYRGTGLTRTVWVVADGWVCMSPAHGDYRDAVPKQQLLADFHESYEVVS